MKTIIHNSKIIIQKMSKKLVIAILALIVIGAPLIYLTVLNQKSASAAWLDPNYAYRQAVSITNAGTDQTDFQISITMDTATLITAGKMQSDCDDIRVFNTDGKKLPFWIETGTNACNTSTTTIWTKVPSIPTSGAQIFVYYGNPSVSSAQDGTQVFEFFDDFSGSTPSSVWTQHAGGGSITETGGVLRLACASGGGCDWWSGSTESGVYIYTPRLSSGNYVIESRINAFDNPVNSHAGVTEVTNDNNASFWGPYRNGAIDQIALEGVDSDAGVSYTTTGVTISNSANTGKLTAKVQRDTSSQYLFNDTSGGSYATWANEGNVGIFLKTWSAAASATVDFDYFYARKYASTEPVATAATEEVGPGPIAYWKFDEGYGTTANNSGSQGSVVNGTLKNMASPATATSGWTNSGKFGKALIFDGSNDYIDIPDSNAVDIGQGQSATISLWYYSTESDTNNHRLLTKQSSHGSGNTDYTFLESISSGASFLWGTGDSADSCSWLTITRPSTNAWHSVIAVLSSTGAQTGTKQLYIDGILKTSCSYTIKGAANSQNLFIGQEGDTSPGEYFQGTIDNLKIYKYALTADQVKADYNQSAEVLGALSNNSSYQPQAANQEYCVPGDSTSCAAPVGRWNFEEGAGSIVNDTSTNSNTGTWNGTLGSQWGIGKIGKGGNFNGSDNYVSVPDATSIKPTGGMTLSAWVYPKSFSSCNSTEGQRIAEKLANYWAFIKSDGTLRVGVHNGDYRDLDASGVLSLNTWQYITLTYDGSTEYVYVNSVQKGSLITSGSITTSTANLNIGNYNGTGCYFNGQIDDVRIYNYARTQQQIVQDMNGGHPPPGSPVGSALGYWKFDEGYATVANNSGNQGSVLNGTLTSMSSPATSTSGWTQSGEFGKALSFDGTGLVSIPDNNSIDLTGSMSISAWFYASSANEGSLVAHTASNGGLGWELDSRSGGVVQLFLDNHGGTSPTYTAGRWNHVVGVYNGSTITVYLNGIPGTPSSYSGNASAVTTRMGIGSRDNNGAFNYKFTGKIDEVKVYNYALTADQVKLDMNRSQAQVLGALSDNSSYQPQAGNQEYCIPGDSTSCASPVGRWDFEEGAGSSVNDTTGNANIGTWNGTLGSQWAVGKIGKGGSFNGSDSYVSVTDASSIDVTTGLTVEFWAYIGANAPAGNWLGIISKTTDTSSLTNGYGVREVATGSTLQFWVGNGTTSSNNSISTIPLNTWHHFALTYTSGSGGTMYEDGVSKGTLSDVGNISPTAAALEFGRHNSGNSFNGEIDQVRIYNYARTPAQVAWDYNKGAPVAYWKFDECQGTTIHDSSGNSNTGTWNGTSGGSQTSAGTCTTSGTAWGNGATGKYNSSLNFDGTDDRVSVSSSNGIPTGNTPYTISAWIKPTSYGTYGIVGWGNWGTTNQVNAFRLTSTGLINYWWGNDLSVTVSDLTDGNWHNVVALFDGTTRRIYVDGISRGSDTPTSHNATFADFNIGRTNTTEYFPGQIDDTTIYNYALTAGQIKTLYNQGSAVRYGPSTGNP